jgi:1,4-alpha-glucan branching enzyme
VITDYDLHLFNEGTHFTIYEKLGAHIVSDPSPGTHFAVWAPNAGRVRLVGDFNGWRGEGWELEPVGASGIWRRVAPGLLAGARYKYEIQSRASGQVLLKSDPYGFFFEESPATASIVWDPSSNYAWGDQDWMAGRSERNSWLDRPASIYEVHLGSWQRVPSEGHRSLTYRELADRLVPYVRALGFTHIELLPVMEHPFTGSWGYQVIGFYAPTSRFGTPQDFKYFVDTCHQHGIGVILDWVPGHFPKDMHGLAWFDGTALYEHADPRQGEHRDWGTLVFNYGRHEVRSFLLANAVFWLREYHIDGLRVDAVASMLYLDYSRNAGEWVPNRFGGRENLEAVEFLRQLNMLTHAEVPGTITVAEESTAFPAVSRPTYVGGLGFTYKWNMGWMHDMLTYVSMDPVYRRWEQKLITFSLLYAFSENFILPFSHDEVVHGKRSMIAKIPGDAWQKAATLRALYGYMYAHPGKKLMFMGSEFGQRREWNHDGSLDWHLLSDERGVHAGIKRFVNDLNFVYQRERSLHEVDFDPAGFQWIDCNDNENSAISLVRRARDPRDFTVALVNFTPIVRYGYRIGVPSGGRYMEILNSDAESYGGGNVGNMGGVEAEPLPSHGHQWSLALTLPPLGFLLLKAETRI